MRSISSQCRERYRQGRGTQRTGRRQRSIPNDRQLGPAESRTQRESSCREGGMPDQPEGESQGGRVLRKAADTQEGRVRLLASLSWNHEHITCGVCTAAVNQGHRVAWLPFEDGNDVIHARCVLVAVRSGGGARGAQVPLVCRKRV